MRHVFTIHNEFGRFFDEQIYMKELVDRMDGVEHRSAGDYDA